MVTYFVIRPNTVGPPKANEYNWDYDTIFSWESTTDTISWTYDGHNYEAGGWPKETFKHQLKNKDTTFMWCEKPVSKLHLLSWLKGGTIGPHENSLKTVRRNR